MTITIAPGVLRGYIDVQFSSAWGKVYKAVLKASASPTGEKMTVAVKCQRPNILETVTLDLLTLRGVVDFFCNLPGEKNKSLRQDAKTRVEKRGRVSRVLSASLPLLAQEDP
eukprot:9472116-Pyramimonas_sp.AAC.2